MGISAAESTTFDIRLTESVTTGAGGIGDRSGLLLRIETDDGRVGRGETAPIPGVAGPGLETIAIDIGTWCDEAIGRSVEDALRELPSNSPLARFAVHTALLDIQGQTVGAPAAQLLSPSPASAVRVNGLVAEANPGAVHSKTTELVASGIAAIKLKVGAGDTATDVTRIIAASEAGGPDIALRLDANGAWDRATAEKVIGRVGRHRVDFIEDPTADASEYRDIQEATGVAVALDIPITENPAALVDHAAVGIAVVKPAAVGGIDRVMALAETHPELRIVVSSSIDREIGLAAAIHAAAALPNHSESHGLATGALVRNIDQALIAQNGTLAVPTADGIWDSDSSQEP